MSEAHNSQLEKKLWQLHKKLIEYYLSLLKREKGETLKGSLVDSIRQFLKDNGVYHTGWNQKQNLEQLMIPGDKQGGKVSKADSNDNGIVEVYRDEDYFDPEGSSSRNTGADEDDGEFNVKH